MHRVCRRNLTATEATTVYFLFCGGFPFLKGDKMIRVITSRKLRFYSPKREENVVTEGHNIIQDLPDWVVEDNMFKMAKTSGILQVLTNSRAIKEAENNPEKVVPQNAHEEAPTLTNEETEPEQEEEVETPKETSEEENSEEGVPEETQEETPEETSEEDKAAAKKAARAARRAAKKAAN